MPGTLLIFFLLMLYAESVFSVCDVRVHTIDLGCHLEWDCLDANPETTFTVRAKQYNEPWKNVSNCIQISQQSCDLSQVFINLETNKYINLQSEKLPRLNSTQLCDPLKDDFAKFSPPSLTISMDIKSLWVSIHFPCAPSAYCMPNDANYVEEEEDEVEEEGEVEELEEKCTCPLNDFKNLLATVSLYNKQDLSDRQTHTAALMRYEREPLRVEFGFLIPGQEYCAVANFTAEAVLDSSHNSLPLCVVIRAKTELHIIPIVFPVLILGIMFLLLWKLYPSSEQPLPKVLAFLRDLELKNETLIDSSKVAPHVELSDVDYISVESFCDFTLMDDQSFYQNCPSLSNGYYTSAILHIPDCTEESEEAQNDELLLFPSHPPLEAEVDCLYQNQREEALNIPLSSVRVKSVQQEAAD